MEMQWKYYINIAGNLERKVLGSSYIKNILEATRMKRDQEIDKLSTTNNLSHTKVFLNTH